MRVKAICILLISVWLVGSSQPGQVNEFGLRVVNSPNEYAKLVKSNPDFELLNLKGLLNHAVFDIRYASTNNFTGKVVYKSPEAFLCTPAAKSFVEVEKYLFDQGICLKVFDAYRPYQATLKFWDLVKDANYAAAPETGSRHNRGCAVDITLVSLKDNVELEMPTPFDDFTEKASSGYMNLPSAVIQNRAIMKYAMEKFGFKQLSSEWWHFDYVGWEKYAVLDIPFDQLPTQ